jgi:hypothetical protein
VEVDEPSLRLLRTDVTPPVTNDCRWLLMELKMATSAAIIATAQRKMVNERQAMY